MKINQLKIGVLGGGQLGRMLINSANDWGLDLQIIDPDPEAPCRALCQNFTVGDIEDAEQVFEFGKDLDLITIEIEKVSVAGLRRLQQHGVKVIPDPEIIEMIQDKAKQKKFLVDNNFPTSPFQLIPSSSSKTELLAHLPFVQKIRVGGYDGHGVRVLKNESDLAQAFQGESLREELVDIDRELAIIVVRNQSGEIKTFDPIEMTMDPALHLVDLLFCPSTCTAKQILIIKNLAEEIATKLNLIGILAIELFLTKSGEILINEMSPRPHNSGHHTIEACTSSQYQQLLRCLLDLPLGSTELNSPAVMINILGAEGYSGLPDYQGLNSIQTPGVFLHLYGKKQTRPGRKMGHITILATDLTSAIKQAKILQTAIKVQA